MNQIQVPKEHYFSQKYNHKARWLSYWYQIDSVLGLKPLTVLETGLGSGVVKDYLKKCGLEVKTFDIDAELNPDFIGSVERIPVPDNSFDCVLAAEILEHLPFSKFAGCLSEIRRVSRRYAVISLPSARRTLINFYLKLPLLPALKIFFQVPSFKVHTFNGQHYWELGKQGFGLGMIEKIIRENGWEVKSSFTPSDVPTKHFFILEKPRA